VMNWKQHYERCQTVNFLTAKFKDSTVIPPVIPTPNPVQVQFSPTCYPHCVKMNFNIIRQTSSRSLSGLISRGFITGTWYIFCVIPVQSILASWISYCIAWWRRNRHLLRSYMKEYKFHAILISTLDGGGSFRTRQRQFKDVCRFWHDIASNEKWGWLR
jgi:hypothetical protein